MTDIPLLIAGLRQSRRKSYARHRHNVGFMAVEKIAERHRFAPWRPRYRGLVSRKARSPGNGKTLLLKPMTYMNDSGGSVGEAAAYMKPPLDLGCGCP